MVQFLSTDDMAPGEDEIMRQIGASIAGKSSEMGLGFFAVFLVPTEDGTHLHYCANVDRSMVKSILDDMREMVAQEEGTTLTVQ